ncbi:MAG TPA: DUF559 domain-containing protein [Actinomycetes bacterium]|nr:DUF559 domain-containing protein [Actinomycetes bacterium]
MDPVAALESMGGYATLAALRSAGVRRRALAAALSDRRVVRARRGVYRLGLVEGVEHLRCAAVSLRAVVSHDSAAVLWGLELATDPSAVVTVPRNRSRARAAGVTVKRADVGETAVRLGLLVTTPLRTVLDCAATLPLEDAVVVADSALRKGLVTHDELRSAADALHGPHGRSCRRVAAMADPRSGSVLESLLRVLLVEAGLAADETQYQVVDVEGRLVARVDFAYLTARLIVEADGFEFHRERADYRKDRRRANAYCLADWSLLRFTWEDVRFDPDYVIAAVRAELVKPPRRVRTVGGQISTQSAA